MRIERNIVIHLPGGGGHVHDVSEAVGIRPGGIGDVVSTALLATKIHNNSHL